jgi:type IV secretory pathway VirB9-like protein
MKRTLSIFAVFMFLIGTAFAQTTTPKTQICDFDGENESKIYSLVTMPGIGTTFRLPDGVKINDFVVTDSRNFHAESNGVIGIVTPTTLDRSTSVNIFADNDKLYVFHLSSRNASAVGQLVVIQSTDRQLFANRVREDAQKLAQDQGAALAARFEADLEKETAQLRRHLLFSVNNNYQVTGNIFSIESVSDDGVFTYVKLARSIERPVVYIGEAKKEKELEVIKYTDEGDYYVIHRVLTPSDRGFVLKLGERTSEIRRRQ